MLVEIMVTVCLSVLEVCEELRRKDPDLFDTKRPKAIAMEILRGCQSDMNMINYESLKIRAAGIITFKLHGSWIAQRIQEMLINGIDTWAPIIYERRARAVFLSLKKCMPHYRFRGDCIKNALARMFLYTGIDVLDNSDSHGASDLTNMEYEVFVNKADLIVHVNPDLHREYIQDCYTAASSTAWLGEAQLLCCGYRIFNDQEAKLGSMWAEYSKYRRSHYSNDIVHVVGYQRDELFGCLHKYALLKSHRLTDCTFSYYEEMFHTEANSFGYVVRTRHLITRHLIHSLAENSESPGIIIEEEEALAGNGERELGLHLVEFTGVIEEACTTLVPDIVCEYLFNLSKLFNSYREFSSGKPKVVLCRATEVVMAKCFDFLGINKGCSIGYAQKSLEDEFLELLAKETMETFNPIIPSPSEASHVGMNKNTHRVIGEETITMIMMIN